LRPLAQSDGGLFTRCSRFFSGYVSLDAGGCFPPDGGASLLFPARPFFFPAYLFSALVDAGKHTHAHPRALRLHLAQATSPDRVFFDTMRPGYFISSQSSLQETVTVHDDHPPPVFLLGSRAQRSEDFWTPSCDHLYG